MTISLGLRCALQGGSIGIDTHFPLAFLKAAEGAGFHLPEEGRIFVSVPDEDKQKIIPIVEKLEQLGFSLVATEGTTQYLNRHGFRVDTYGKVFKEKRNILEDIKEGKVGMIFNTPSGIHEWSDA